MQQLDCQHCGRKLEYSDEPPRFCGYCGQTLSTFMEPGETLAAAPQPPSTPSSVVRLSGETEDLRGKVLGEYRLVQEIGRGGMGIVYEAEQLAGARRVAVKLLGKSVPKNTIAADRFIREGKLAAALNHPRTTFVYDACEVDGRFYIAMELMPGETLREAVLDKLPRVEQAVDWLLDVLDGLEAAHRAGIVHRDVKPSNCFLDADGRVKIGDFGLSKSLVEDAELTSTGSFMGTPLYAAPEQLKGGEITTRTDQYSLGATLFYLLCGQAPFEGDFATVIARIVSETAPSARTIRPDLPLELCKIIARMLEKDPAKRFASLHEVRVALTPYSSGGTSIATLGRRMAAYSMDYLGSSFVATIVAVAVVLTIFIASASAKLTPALSLALMLQIGITTLVISYFVIFEGFFGRALGKRLMGLRTVTLSGNRPGFFRSLIRAVFYPGILVIPSVLTINLTLTNQQQAGTSTSLLKDPLSPIYDLLFTMAGLVLSLFGFVTARSTNGYRGIHEFLTGTRVMSVRTGRQGVTLPVADDTAPPLGGEQADLELTGYDVNRVVGGGDGYRIIAAVDKGLNRPTWIYAGTNEAGNAMVDSLPTVARPSRQQWLRGGKTGAVRWQAYDVISAIPLAQAVGQHGKLFRWGFRRALFLQLAEELLAAVKDGTLPRSLSLDQVLVDREGRLKLLNLPLRKDSDTANGDPEHAETSPADVEPAAAACALLVQVMQTCRGLFVVPSNDQRILDELQTMAPSADALEWAVTELRDAVTRPSRLRWDHRLGLISISFMTEFTIYMGLLGTLTALPLVTSNLKTQQLLVGIASVALFLIPVLLAAWLNGGAVFRFAGIEVLRRDGRPASRARCAWRAFVAWFFLFVPVTAAIFIAVSIGPQAASGDDIDVSKFLVFGLLGVIVISFLLFAGGAIFAVAAPRRSLQDHLAGTILMPK